MPLSIDKLYYIIETNISNTISNRTCHIEQNNVSKQFISVSKNNPTLSLAHKQLTVLNLVFHNIMTPNLIKDLL